MLKQDDTLVCNVPLLPPLLSLAVDSDEDPPHIDPTGIEVILEG